MSSLHLTPEAAGQLAELAALADDGLETGGILLGADHGLPGPVIVTSCGGPGPKAVRRPSYFRRDLAHSRALAEQAAALDGSVWIGEWHTHGVTMPEPSDRDLRTYRRLLEDPDLGFARIVAVIVLAGPGSNWHMPVAHAWSFTGTVLRELHVSGLPISDRNSSKPRDQT